MSFLTRFVHGVWVRQKHQPASVPNVRPGNDWGGIYGDLRPTVKPGKVTSALVDSGLQSWGIDHREIQEQRGNDEHDFHPPSMAPDWYHRKGAM